MKDRLESELIEYIDSRLIEVKSLIIEPCQDLLPVDLARAELGKWLKDVDLDGLDWHKADRFYNLGANDNCWWLRAPVKLPEPRADRHLALEFDIGTQTGVGHGALLYINGREYESFTPRWEGLFAGHEISILPHDLPGGEEVQFLLKCYAGRDHGVFGRARPKLLNSFRLVWYDPIAAGLYCRGTVIRRVIETLDPSGGTHRRLAELLKSALQRMDFSEGQGDKLRRSVGKARNELEKGLTGITRNDADMITLAAVGHAHIDTGWTWPYIVSREKAVQTFATALGLIDRYEEFIFQQGQPQLYQFVKHDAPSLYGRIRSAVATGQWDADGAAWVEPDCNIPSGESLVRQLLYGRRFFREEFGVDSRVFWVPDSFGFPYTLPQIARGCGVEFFVTTKISWNRYNTFPYTFFNWQGPDGTTLPTYFMTVKWRDVDPQWGQDYDTYNAFPDPVRIARGWKKRFPKEANRTMLNSIGWGDGGGGTTYEMIEWVRALDGFAGKFQARWQKVYDFLKTELEECDFELPIWRDELFLEFHRGTLTTHADLKKFNRIAEFELAAAELVCALADPAGYPAEEFRQVWGNVLLNQFHDVTAGSAARDVFEEARRIYLDAISQARSLRTSASAKLFNTNEQNGTIVVLNTLGAARPGLVELDLPEGKALSDHCGNQLPMTRVSGDKCLVDPGKLPSVGFRRFHVVDDEAPPTTPNPVSTSGFKLENQFLRVEFDTSSGLISSIFDKQADREVLAGPANELQLFEDKPFERNLSAWEIDRIYQEKPYKHRVKLLSFEPFGGSLRAGFLAEWQVMHSKLRQEIYLDHDRPVIHFKTWVDWRENETMLKAAFPVEVNAAQACFDIQFGHIYRPTHRNTPWDIARFEVPCQKWFDLSEGDYGVSLLNDCKFGCDVQGNVLRLTLLRSTIHPDPSADRGFHEFTYALYPHKGPWWQAKTINYAKQLNLKPIVLPADAEVPPERSFIQLSPQELVLETVKGAEDGNAVVLRFYEGSNTRGRGTVTFDLPFKPKRAALCDMEENDLKDLLITSDCVTFDYRPCEILTIKLLA